MMRCSKCGGEIKNLPDYVEETGAEVVCTQCSGFATQSGDNSPVYSRSSYLKELSIFRDDLEVAA